MHWKWFCNFDLDDPWPRLGAFCLTCRFEPGIRPLLSANCVRKTQNRYDNVSGLPDVPTHPVTSNLINHGIARAGGKRRSRAGSFPTATMRVIFLWRKTVQQFSGFFLWVATRESICFVSFVDSLQFFWLDVHLLRIADPGGVIATLNSARERSQGYGIKINFIKFLCDNCDNCYRRNYCMRASPCNIPWALLLNVSRHGELARCDIDIPCTVVTKLYQLFSHPARMPVLPTPWSGVGVGYWSMCGAFAMNCRRGTRQFTGWWKCSLPQSNPLLMLDFNISWIEMKMQLHEHGKLQKSRYAWGNSSCSYIILLQ